MQIIGARWQANRKECRTITVQVDIDSYHHNVEFMVVVIYVL
jgi:hypothetical protein